MARARALVLVLLLAPEAARASDFSGMLSALFGLPVLIVGVLVAGAFLAFAPTRTRRTVALVLLVPILIAGFLLLPDALSLLRYSDWGMVLSYAVLLFVLLILTLRIATRLGPSDPD